MADFLIPRTILESPYYQDAIIWVYVHMLVIGLIIGALGMLAKDPVLRIRMARLLLLAHILYTVMDFRSADWSLGNGLYQGDASLIPAFLAAFMTLFFVNLSFNRRACGFA